MKTRLSAPEKEMDHIWNILEMDVAFLELVVEDNNQKASNCHCNLRRCYSHHSMYCMNHPCMGCSLANKLNKCFGYR